MTLKQLEEIKAKVAAEMNFRRSGTPFEVKHEIMVCASTGCVASKSHEIIKALKEKIAEKGLEKEVRTTQVGCLGLCAVGPVVIVYPDDTFYSHVKVEDVEEILESHIKQGKIVDRLLMKTADGGKNETKKDIKFFQKQVFIARNNAEFIDPENIEDYMGVDGYKALHKAVTEMSPEQVIALIKESGLRGRGGAGFPTGNKWEFASKYQNDIKYVICNADEGDPGAFMDRSILESNPHAIIEAMAINGYAIGASQGYIYVRAEYPLAAGRMQKAIDDARAHGLLGKNIFGKFDFDLRIKFGAGAFVCGEETALLASIEGRRGEPNAKPPFPAERGLFGKPSNINNVETYACIPQIVLNGAEWFKSQGTPTSTGTKVFAVTGKINNTGLIELPMGTTLREIIFDVCGGIPNGKAFKAVQIGGPSGTCIPSSQLDLNIDYDSLRAASSMMGSGGIIVLDEDSCMVDVAKFFLEFTCDESCGKCTPCRVGNKRMLELLTKITDGKGTLADIDKLEKLAVYVRDNSLCGLGQTSPNPVLSTIKHFRDEYIAHVTDKRCPAGVCKSLLSYRIDKAKCVGCSLCARICPVGAISGSREDKYTIDPVKCVKCGKCEQSCRFKAIFH